MRGGAPFAKNAMRGQRPPKPRHMTSRASAVKRAVTWVGPDHNNLGKSLIRWITAVENLLDGGSRYREVIFVLFQPLVIIRLNLRRPPGIDLSSGVLLLLQTQVAKGVFQMGSFGFLDNSLRKLGRYEKHTAIPAKHHIARHHQGLTDARRSIDPHHGRVEPGSACERSEVMGWVVVAHKRREVWQFVQAIDVADGAIVDDAVSGSGIDRISYVVANRWPILLESEMVGHVNVARLEHVDGPRIGCSLWVVLCALIFNNFLNVGSARHPNC